MNDTVKLTRAKLNKLMELASQKKAIEAALQVNPGPGRMTSSVNYLGYKFFIRNDTGKLLLQNLLHDAQKQIDELGIEIVRLRQGEEK